MPKIVDHDERRREIVAAAWRVLARDGLASTTTRSIAVESGYSHGILAHYFTDKDHILQMALGEYYELLAQRVHAAMQDRRGIDALREVLLIALPLDPASTLANQVLVTLWARAAVDDEFREMQARGFRSYRAALTHLVTSSRQARELDPHVDTDLTADHLLAVVDGLSIEAALFPNRYSAAHIRGVVEEALSRLSTQRRTSRVAPSRSRATKAPSD